MTNARREKSPHFAPERFPGGERRQIFAQESRLQDEFETREALMSALLACFPSAHRTERFSVGPLS